MFILLVVMKRTISHLILSLPTPSSITLLWNVGSFLGLILLFQIILGVLLSFHFDGGGLFMTVEALMRNTGGGYFLRAMHLNLASLFFILIYIHLFRGLLYKSTSDVGTWNSGIIMFSLLMLTAFVGYVLPWGQMSFWAAKVITGFSVLLGPNLSQLVWGDLGVSKETLTFFFTLHFLLPLILFIIVIFHLSSLHGGGSSAPIQSMKITFSPTYLIKDSLNLMPFLFLFLFLGLWVTSEADNFIRVDETTGPSHIKPEWYFLFAYAILRSVPHKASGFILMALAVLSLMLMSQSPKLKTFSLFIFFGFVFNFLLLSWVGGNPAVGIFVPLSGVLSISYFFFLLLIFQKSFLKSLLF